MVRSHLRSNGLADLVDNAELIVSELVGNVVLHVGGTVEVAVEVDADEVLLSVTDGSPLSPHLRVFSRTSSTGRGMRLVTRCRPSTACARTATARRSGCADVASSTAATTRSRGLRRHRLDRRAGRRSTWTGTRCATWRPRDHRLAAPLPVELGMSTVEHIEDWIASSS
jgi:hypothetical protein